MARYRPPASAVIVAHAFVLPTGALALWAETSEPAAAPQAAVKRQARAHPFATAPPVDGPAMTAMLLLPSTRSTPLASPELGRRKPRGEVRTRPWLVPAVLVDPGSDPEQLVEQEPDVLAGASVGHLADAVAFAADLARRGRVLPGLVDDSEGGLRAQWRAALHGVDAARLSDLARTTPAVAFAGGAWSPTQALQALLDHQIDAQVRHRLVEPLLPGAAGESVTHTWLRALTGPRPQVVGDQVQLRQLRERLEEWHRSGAPAALRVCFRLTYVEEGPDDEEPGWMLEFLLQPLADPSVLIPASQIWSDLSPALLSWLDVDDERAVDPPEILLAGLGRASRVYPDLDDALHQAHPIGLALDVAGAYRFLTHAPLLAEAGFGVLLPAAWQQPTRLGLSLEVHTRQDTHPVLRDETVDHDTLVDYRWRLALGSQTLSDADLRLLARAKVPLVRLRGRWVYLDEAQLAAGLAFLTRRPSGQLPVAEVLRLVGLAPERDLPLPVTDVAGSGWLADLLGGRDAERLTLVEPPRSLTTALRPYQLRGLSWLAFLDRLGVGALLADDMGLGKTVQLLALEAWLRERGPRPPTLIVCPLSVLGNWQREIARFTPHLSVHVHHGPARRLPATTDLVLTTYQIAASDAESPLGHVTWDRIVLDEAQHVKNSATATARAIRGLPARHRVALTGTPVENRLAELWSIMDFLNPGLLGRLSTFRARYAVPVERYGDTAAATRLRRATGPFLLRRLKTDQAVIADLPEKLERIQWCNLTVEQATLYRAVIDELTLRLAESRAGMPRKGLVLAAITKLKQVCNHPAHLLRDGSPLPGRSGKIDRLEEILANALADGDRAVVFTQFARLGTMLTPYLSARLGTHVAFLHGGTRKNARDELVQRFGREDGPAVLLVSVKAGGTGLNLTAANHVVHLDRWWNPATEAQATDRAFRIGQRRDVQVHTLVCLGTVEERIHQLIGRKRGLAQLAVGTGDGWLTTLSTQDLLDVVALRPEVVDG